MINYGKRKREAAAAAAALARGELIYVPIASHCILIKSHERWLPAAANTLPQRRVLSLSPSRFQQQKDESPDPAQDRKIDLSEMDERDLKSLHTSDPFMYYSIPGVLKASLNLEDVDYSDITSRSRSRGDLHPSSSPSQSHPRQEREATDDDASKVSRRTRVSFECHPSVLMEDMMDDLDVEFGDEVPDLDEILSLLFESKRASSTRQ